MSYFLVLEGSFLLRAEYLCVLRIEQIVMKYKKCPWVSHPCLTFVIFLDRVVKDLQMAYCNAQLYTALEIFVL
jgi:hypothetical protein